MKQIPLAHNVLNLKAEAIKTLHDYALNEKTTSQEAARKFWAISEMAEKGLKNRF